MAKGYTGTKDHMRKVTKVYLDDEGKGRIRQAANSSSCGNKLGKDLLMIVDFWRVKRDYPDTVCQKCLINYTDTVRRVRRMEADNIKQTNKQTNNIAKGI